MAGESHCQSCRPAHGVVYYPLQGVDTHKSNQLHRPGWLELALFTLGAQPCPNCHNPDLSHANHDKMPSRMPLAPGPGDNQPDRAERQRLRALDANHGELPQF